MSKADCNARGNWAYPELALQILKSRSNKSDFTPEQSSSESNKLSCDKFVDLVFFAAAVNFLWKNLSRIN
jgi:hypothetical protein